MKTAPFRLERFFAQYEFKTPYLLCSSDCESIEVKDLLQFEPAARQEFEHLWLGYTESLGNPVLREEISHLYSELGPEQFLVHTGAEEGIYLFLNAVLDPGDHVILHWPCYQSLYEVARSIGCEITLWVGNVADNWRLDPSFVEKNLRPNTRAILINCPHNPTGYQMAMEDWMELNRLSERYGFLVFSDEVYHSLEYRVEDRLPSFCDINERAISLNVLSKAFGLAGLRIGWIGTRNADVYNRIAALKDYTTICNSGPSEFLATLALRYREALLKRNRDIIFRNLDVLDGFFSRNADMFHWIKPIAGPIAFPSLVNGETASDFCRSLIDAAGVLLLPGDLYGPAYSNHFRIGFGRKNLPEAVEKLEGFLSSRK